jgi:GT2 family glycosyltransferase
MKLSVIIVSYNVRHFLEQCIKSVIRASHSLDVDIVVVDNHSEDDSVSMVQTLFPKIKLIVNEDNIGFSKANNQAILQSEGNYILLLNPDTLLEESVLISTLNFMETHPEAGGLGIKMIDGYGHYLHESKRGLPTPWAAFCKMSHLSQLFPHSRFFNHYYMGYLPINEINKIEVLAGAFMLLNRKILDKIGLLDEDFFMYGEDIDLSFRITEAGYFNYYFPEALMIHYKGESTRKSSLNYVKMFYGAMLIFARKHFVGKNRLLLSLLILPGVYFRAALAMLNRLFHSGSGEKTSTHPTPKKRKVLIIANQVESNLIKEMLNQDNPGNLKTHTIDLKNGILGIIDAFEPGTRNHSIGFGNSLAQYPPTEIIFSAADLTTDQIIFTMCLLNEHSIPFRIAYTDTSTIIGSNFVSSR